MIPKIDTDIGISIYSTSSQGCGGKIRQNAEDFLVSEILSDKTMSLIKQNDGYAVYKLKKQNIDTNHALKDVFHKRMILFALTFFAMFDTVPLIIFCFGVVPF